MDDNSSGSFTSTLDKQSHGGHGGRNPSEPSDSSSSSDSDGKPSKKGDHRHNSRYSNSDKDYEESERSVPPSRKFDNNSKPPRLYNLKELDTITNKIERFGKNMKSDKLDGDLKKERCVENLGKVLDEIQKDLLDDPVIQDYLKNESVQSEQYSLGEFNSKLARTIAKKDSVLLAALNSTKNLKNEIFDIPGV